MANNFIENYLTENTEELSINGKIKQEEPFSFSDVNNIEMNANKISNYWNESVQELSDRFKKLINHEGKTEGKFSDHFSAILNGDAAKDFRDKFVQPEKNIEDISYLSARTDEILSVLKNSNNLDYTRTRSIDKYLRLIMPQYLRRVEVEDLNRNFWVIAQVISRISDYLFNPDSLLNTIIGGILTEIIHLWQNTYRIWQAINEMNIRLTDIENMLGIGDEITIQLNGPKIVSSIDNFSFENLFINIFTGSGSREIKTPFTNILKERYEGEVGPEEYSDAENPFSYPKYCYKFNEIQRTKNLTTIRADMLFYGDMGEENQNGASTVGYGNLRKKINNGLMSNNSISGENNQQRYKNLLNEQLITSFHLYSGEENILIINKNDYEIIENEYTYVPLKSIVKIRDKIEKKDITFTNTAIVYSDQLFNREMILIALGTVFNGVTTSEDIGIKWEQEMLNQLPLSIAHSQQFNYGHNNYFVLKESELELPDAAGSQYSPQIKGFKAYYFRPKQSKQKPEKNSKSFYNPIKCVQLINNIKKEDIFTQRFYLIQGEGNHIDYQYYHGQLQYCGTGSTLSSDFAEHGLIGLLSYDDSKIISDNKNNFLYYNSITKNFENNERISWNELPQDTIKDKFQYILNNSLNNLNLNDDMYINNHQSMLELVNNITSKYKGVLPIFSYSGIVSQPFISVILTGLSFYANPKDSYLRTANQVCIIPIFSNWDEAGGYKLDIGIRNKKIILNNDQCFSWDYSSNIAEGNLSKLLYRYLYGRGEQAIIPINPYYNNLEYKYLIGYLLIFANNDSNMTAVDINGLKLYGKVINNNKDYFINGANIDKSDNIICDSIWG